MPNAQCCRERRTPEASYIEVRLLGQLLDLVTQHFALRDGHLLLAALTRLGATQQLARTGAGNDDELETIVLGRALHVLLPFHARSGRAALHTRRCRVSLHTRRPRASFHTRRPRASFTPGVPGPLHPASPGWPTSPRPARRSHTPRETSR